MLGHLASGTGLSRKLARKGHRGSAAPAPRRNCTSSVLLTGRMAIVQKKSRRSATFSITPELRRATFDDLLADLGTAMPTDLVNRILLFWRMSTAPTLP